MSDSICAKSGTTVFSEALKTYSTFAQTHLVVTVAY